ncbi:MAG TPA: hypothetical protein VJG66_03670 [Patescibacteria group bacterium]|nr:hypothetical protein [Patescibacteria group bacterium]
MALTERFQFQTNPSEVEWLTRAVSILVEPPEGKVVLYTTRNILDRKLGAMVRVPSLYLVPESTIPGLQIDDLIIHQEPIAEIWPVGEKFDIRYSPAAINPRAVTEEALRRGIVSARIYDEQRN